MNETTIDQVTVLEAHLARQSAYIEELEDDARKLIAENRLVGAMSEKCDRLEAENRQLRTALETHVGTMIEFDEPSTEVTDVDLQRLREKFNSGKGSRRA